MAIIGQVGQQTLFPALRKAVWVQPANLGTADCQLTGRCDDSCEYAIKTKAPNIFIPHCEWFCTHLADLVGIAGPGCAIIEMQDGSTAFGSAWHDGAIPSGLRPSSPAPWWQMVVTNAIPLASVRTTLSRIYAFDHFVHNVDRHAGNFLVLKQQVGHAIKAFDYSRAWVTHGFPLPALPFDANNPSSKTLSFQRQLRALVGDYVDAPAAKALLDVIAQVPVARVAQIIDEHPSDWLDDATKGAILAWWASADMIARLEGIATGIQNGSYL